MQKEPATPFFAFHVFCCTNRRGPGNTRGSCAEKGAEDLRDYMKTRAKQLGIASTRINAAGCLDRCELGPCVVIYPEGIWYRIETRQDVDEILTQHLRQGHPVARLRLPS